MKTRKQQDYNQAIDLISHLILKRPDTVISLLGEYGIRFREAPNRKELIAATVTMLKDTESKFIEDLGDLVTVHIQKNGKELLQLENKEYHAFVDEEEEDEFFGALAKTAIGIVGGLLGKKRKRRSSGGGSNTNRSSATNSAALAASRAEARRIADQSRRIQMDMQRQVQEMQRREQERQAKQQEEMRRLREEQRKREEEQKRQEEVRIQKMKEEAKKSRNTILMISGGVGGLLLIGIIGFVATKKPAAMVPRYAPPMPLTR